MGLGIGNASTNPIPSLVSNCNVYLAGNILFGTAELQLPKIEFATNELSGPGIAGSVEVTVPGHVKPMEASVKFHVPTGQQFDMVAAFAQGITFRAAILEYDTATGGPTYKAIAVEMKGAVKVLDPGKFKPGEASDGSNDITVSYLKITIDNKVRCEIDPLNGRCFINGTDQLAAIAAMI